MASSSVRLGVCVLPEHPWPTAAPIWRRIEELGFHSAWTYDHITWSGLPSGPWYAAWPTLTAAAAVTSRVRLGTLVSSANFRHPVPFAQEVMTLDDISGGRLTVGLGAGSQTADATVLGGVGWPARERADRFSEFVELLDTMLAGAPAGRPRTTYQGAYYEARDARLEPGCVRSPRTAFAIAASGPRGMRLAAQHAQTWVCVDAAAGVEDREAQLGAIAAQVAKLDEQCAKAGRDPRTLDRLVLTGFGPDRPLATVSAFEDTRGRYAELGFTDLVVHHPRPAEPFAAGPDILEAIAEL
jgi:alkanesulfonate monooxygenase SsuD/methylene tetrahydromethanopterin reductase-like flavin-dependent oxidoreductase (luciferase family)